MEQHKAFRLDHAGATKKGKIQESATVKALHALRGIRDILPTSQLTDLQNQLASVKVCYELTVPELQKQCDCPHCHFNPADNDGKPVHGRLGAIEDHFDDMLSTWTGRLEAQLQKATEEYERNQEICPTFTPVVAVYTR